jgi:CelD/BcsL family acetyltransferase involved in cellulose biosynthesis
MLEFKVITDLATARQLWSELSPGESVFDLWDFRYCFYQYEPYPLYFIAAYETSGEGQTELVGLMPLDRHPEHGYEFLAEDACEESRPLVRSGREDLIPLLYEQVPAPAKFFDISGNDSYTMALPLEDYKYTVSLEGWRDFNDFLTARLSPKKRRNIKQELRELENNSDGEDSGRLEIVWNNTPDIEDLFELNVENFGEDSYLNQHGRQGWRGLLDTDLNCQLVAVKKAGRTVAASLAIYYNHTYYYLINGVTHNINNLGKYLNKINIERAISLGAKFFDAGLGDCNWKEAWHFDRVPQYKFIKL